VASASVICTPHPACKPNTPRYQYPQRGHDALPSSLTRIGEAFLNSATSIRLSSLSLPRHLHEKMLPLLAQRKHTPGIDFIEEREQLKVLCQVHLRNHKPSCSLVPHPLRSAITKYMHEMCTPAAP
jgi:hypothetical protein